MGCSGGRQRSHSTTPVLTSSLAHSPTDAHSPSLSSPCHSLHFTSDSDDQWPVASERCCDLRRRILRERCQRLRLRPFPCGRISSANSNSSSSCCSNSSKCCSHDRDRRRHERIRQRRPASIINQPNPLLRWLPSLLPLHTSAVARRPRRRRMHSDRRRQVAALAHCTRHIRPEARHTPLVQLREPPPSLLLRPLLCSRRRPNTAAPSARLHLLGLCLTRSRRRAQKLQLTVARPAATTAVRLAAAASSTTTAPTRRPAMLPALVLPLLLHLPPLLSA